MSENKAFKVNTYGTSPLTIFSSMDNITLRFGSELPTEIEHPFKDTFDVYVDSRDKNWKELERIMKHNGASDKELEETRKKFNSESLAELRSTHRDLMNNKIKEVTAVLSKMSIAFTNVAKQKLLEVIHTSDEANKKLEESIAELAKSYDNQ